MLNYKVFIQNLLKKSIPIQVIANIILLSNNKRNAFQTEPETFSNLKQVDYFSMIIELFQIIPIIYRNNSILDGYTIYILKKNKEKIYIDRILKSDHYYIGQLLNIENSLLNYRDLFTNKNKTQQPFQIRIIISYSDKCWNDLTYNQELLAEFNMPDFIRGCIFCFLTTNYNLPKTFTLIKDIQSYFVNLEIPIRVHLEMDPQPDYWLKYDSKNDRHRPIFQ